MTNQTGYLSPQDIERIRMPRTGITGYFSPQDIERSRMFRTGITGPASYAIGTASIGPVYIQHGNTHISNYAKHEKIYSPNGLHPFRPVCVRHRIPMRPIVASLVVNTHNVPVWKCPKCNEWLMSPTTYNAIKVATKPCKGSSLDYECALEINMSEGIEPKASLTYSFKNIKELELYEL